MKIEKIEKTAKEIKNFVNNLDIIGIYNCSSSKRKLEFQLTTDRFLKQFKNQVKNMYFECGKEKSRADIRSVMYGNYIKDYDIELCYKIGGVKFFCLINTCYEYRYMKDFIISKTKLFLIK